MKRYSLLVFLFCTFFFGFSQNSSSIDFVIKNLGINVDGHFNTFTISPELSSDGKLTGISGKITVSSIKTGIDSRDEHLLEEDYFDTKNHKFIQLKSTSVKKSTSNSYTVKANLTIKGTTKAIEIKVIVDKSSDNYKIKSSFEINRKDFDVGGGSFVMSKTVKINVIHYEK